MAGKRKLHKAVAWSLLCGAPDHYEGAFDWRDVTCKRCLAQKRKAAGRGGK